MNPCKKCGEVSLGKLVIFTETTFGHGDSGHITYVKCTNCDSTSASFSGYGLFDDKDLRKAQSDWNRNNPGPYDP